MRQESINLNKTLPPSWNLNRKKTAAVHCKRNEVKKIYSSISIKKFVVKMLTKRIKSSLHW